MSGRLVLGRWMSGGRIPRYLQHLGISAGSYPPTLPSYYWYNNRRRNCLADTRQADVRREGARQAGVRQADARCLAGGFRLS